MIESGVPSASSAREPCTRDLQCGQSTSTAQGPRGGVRSLCGRPLALQPQAGRVCVRGFLLSSETQQAGPEAKPQRPLLEAGQAALG